MPSTLAIGVGLARGFDRASTNFMVAMQASQNLKIQKQKNELEFKKGELEIKKMELDQDPEMVAGKRELLKYQQNAAKSLDDLRIAQVENEKTKLKRTLEQQKTALDFFQPLLEKAKTDPNIMAALSFDTTGKIAYAPQKQANVPADVYASMLPEAKKRATKTAKTRGWWGGGKPTAEEVDNELQGMIKTYRSQSPAPGLPAMTDDPAADEGQKPPAAAAVNEALPDPSLYEDGTTIETDAGVQHKLVNGAWEPVEA